jgi:hypothetical protein
MTAREYFLMRAGASLRPGPRGWQRCCHRRRPSQRLNANRLVPRALPRTVVLIVAVLAAAPAVPAQERDSIVTLAIRHREAGRFEAAIQMLAPHVARARPPHTVGG